MTLEKDKGKLDVIKYDLEFEVDPLFKNMTVKFNESGARSLLLNNLPIDLSLDVLLESKPLDKFKIDKNFDENTLKIIQGIILNLIIDLKQECEGTQSLSKEIFSDLTYFKTLLNDHSGLEKLESTAPSSIEKSLFKKFSLDKSNDIELDNEVSSQEDQELYSIHSNDIVIEIEDNNLSKFTSEVCVPEPKTGINNYNSLPHLEIFGTGEKLMFGTSNVLNDIKGISFENYKPLIAKKEEKSKIKKDKLLFDFLGGKVVRKEEIFNVKNSKTHKAFGDNNQNAETTVKKRERLNQNNKFIRSSYEIRKKYYSL